MNWREKVEEILKKCWGLLPLLVVLICVALVKAIEALNGDTLRSVPSLILMGFGICSVAVALLWANIRLIFAGIPLRVLGVLLKITIPILSCVLVVYLGAMSVVVMPAGFWGGTELSRKILPMWWRGLVAASVTEGSRNRSRRSRKN